MVHYLKFADNIKVLIGESIEEMTKIVYQLQWISEEASGLGNKVI